MKQTAVEWLAKELESYGDPQFCKIEWEQLDSLIQQAKEMEKEQINDACYDGYYQEGMYDTREYYDKKYKQQSSSYTEKQIETLLVKVDEGTIPVQQALGEILLLASTKQSLSFVEINEFFDEMAEDWHLWDEQEKGQYPVQRTFDAVKKFMEQKKLRVNR